MTEYPSLITANQPFFVTGGTLRRDAACYVVRQADRELYTGLKQGRFCYVLTSRQMGKSSLMVRTAARLREEGCGVAILDLTAIGQNLSGEQWYRGLLGQMGDELDLEDELIGFWRANKDLGTMQRWMRAIRDIVLPRYPGPVVIFVDEIDAVRSLPFSTDEFFAAIREFHNRRTEDEELERLTFCLLGVATPSDLIRDTRTTPFNVGQRIDLHDFTESESATLAQGLKSDEKIAAVLIGRVHLWTNGHPYLTQRLCQAVAETNPQPSIPNPRTVDRLCEQMFLTPRARERDDNLLFVRERMLHSEVELAGLLQTYEQVRRHKRVPDDKANPLVSVLHLSGIVCTENGRLRERNRIYARVFDRKWIKANMPDAEVKRQHAAFRRGLLRATAVSAVIIAVMTFLIWLTFEQRNLAIEQQMVNRRLLYAAHMNLAHQAWEASDIGRMEELLTTHVPQPGQEDLRGFEWYYLWRLSHSFLYTLHHTDVVFSVAFSPDGKRLASGSFDRTVRLWDVATGQVLNTLKGHDGEVFSVMFSPDGKWLATGSADGTARLWDAATGQELTTLKGHEKMVLSVAFFPDGKRLATVSIDSTIRLWDAPAGQLLAILKGHANRIRSLAISPDGRRIATGSDDLSVRLWDVTTGQVLKILKGYRMTIKSVAFSPDGKRLATGSGDRTVNLWDVSTGREIVTLKGHAREILSVAFSPDGKRLASGGMDHTVKLWDVITGNELATLKGHADTIWSITFSPDGNILATGSQDKNVKLWHAATEKEVLTQRKP